jgi:hypothetical protein
VRLLRGAETCGERKYDRHLPLRAVCPANLRTQAGDQLLSFAHESPREVFGFTVSAGSRVVVYSGNGNGMGSFTVMRSPVTVPAT